MKKKSTKDLSQKLTVGVGAIALLAACSADPLQRNSDVKAQGLSESLERTTTTLVDQSEDGKTKVYKTTMSQPDIEYTRKAYKEIALADFPVSSSFGATLRHMPKVEKFNNMVFVDPTLYVYDANQGGSAFHDNGDGTTSITFNGVFIDALNATAPSPDRSTEIAIPPANLVQEPNRLKAELNAAGKTLAFLPGCLERVELNVDGQAFEAVPNLRGVELCGLQNRPMVFSTRIPNKIASHLFELLDRGLVQVNVFYQVGVPFSPRSVTVTFDKRMFHKELLAKLKYDDHLYTDAEIDIAIRELAQGSKFAVIYRGNLQGERERLILDLVAKAKELFFERVTPKTPAEQAKCSSARACLRLTVIEDKAEQTFSASVSEEDIATTKVNLATWAILKAHDRVFAHVERFGRDQRLSLTLSVSPGQAVKLKVTKVAEERRKRLMSGGGLERALPGEVLDTHIAKINSCPGHHDRKSCDTWGCWWERVCNEPQDQGYDEAKMWFEAPYARYDHIHEPVGKVSYDIFGSLALVVSQGSSRGSYEIKCNLMRDFRNTGTGSELTFIVEDTPGCQPFKLSGREKIQLKLENNIHAGARPLERRILIRQWNENAYLSSRSELPVTFEPKVEIYGEVSLPGLAIRGRPTLHK